MSEGEKNQPLPESRRDFSNLRALGITALAGFLYLLLADAAIETFYTRSPIRWWVAVVVAIYLVGSVALWWFRNPLWKRIEWETKATISFFVLLGLLALTVWLPGGLTNGLRLLSFSTSALLTVVTAVAVAYSGMILMRPSYRHPAIKWVIGAVAAYGVIAFLWGIFAGTPYPALFSGHSFWSWLPRWLQGGFIGALVIVPLAIVVHVTIRLRRPSESRDWRFQQVVPLAIVLATTVAAVTVPARSAIAPEQISNRGPGMKRQALDTFQLPVPRTFDLTHVEPAHFAVALGKDPAKIFEFMRDNIAYEVYTGSLRGPRGTLMAMAGNSVDRASLLASMLQHAGHRVRYVRGTLPDREARELVTSMWAERPRAAEPKVEGEPSPALKAALDTLVAGVKRDYTLIRDHLKKANVTPSPASAPRLDSLVQEAQEHYWVQWWKDNAWVDLDPSFADATPGRRYAPVAETFDPLPEKLFHQVSIRIQLEEYEVLLTGNAEGKPSSRTILTYTAKAADLSGKDVVLTHQPENWKGPADSLESALSSAIEKTGRMKPVLLVGEQPVMGEPFRQKPPTGAGIGGITNLLGGAGTRKPVPVATAETIEFDFISPGGRKETVVREIFDVVGKARRAAGQDLNAAEVRARTEAKTAFDVTQAVYNLFFTTGRVDAAHLLHVETESSGIEDEDKEFLVGLRRISVALVATSDALLPRAERPNGDVVGFYPVSPRLVISEISNVFGRMRLAIDLRRSSARAVTTGSDNEEPFLAQVYRGVLDGTLERVLGDYLASDARGKGELAPVMTTSTLLEQAQAQGVPIVILPPDSGKLEANLPEDLLARLRQETSAGYLAIAPRARITVDGVPRFAWWRIDPASGHAVAVTDEGLHAFEYKFVKTKNINIFRGTIYQDGRQVFAGIFDKTSPAGRKGIIAFWGMVKRFKATLKK